MSDRVRISLERSVYDLCKEHPEILSVLKELGFTDITKPGMLQTTGRFVTIPRGAKMKNISMRVILEKLRERGFDPAEGGNG